MNLLEAIQNCGENWFRPVKWKGMGSGYKLEYENIIYVESSGYTKPHFTRNINLISDEWEIVTPEQVMKEMK